MAYDYRDTMKEDIINSLSDYNENFKNASDNDALYDSLYDAMFIDDSITGNASGSYTFNSYKAMENLFTNDDLLTNMVDYFGIDPGIVQEKFTSGNYEYFDVSIRCYLLSEILSKVVRELEYKINDEIFYSLEDAKEYASDFEYSLTCYVIFDDKELLEFQVN